MASTAWSKREIKDDLYDANLSFRFELTKHLRRKRLLIVAALALLVPLIFYVYTPDSASEFAAGSLTFLSILIVASGALFAGDAICGEFEKKTGLLLFPTPQRRISIFTGKYVAALAATFLVVSLYYLVTVLQISHLYGVGEIPSELGKSFLTALIYVTSVVSIMFFLSSILKRSMSATILGFVSLMMILPVLAMVLSSVDIEPWFIVTYSAGLISSVLGEVSLGHGPGRFSSVYEPTFVVGIVVMVVYTVAGFLSSMAIGSRKSME